MRYEIAYHPERDEQHDHYDVMRGGRWFASYSTREQAQACINVQQGYDQYDLDKEREER